MTPKTKFSEIIFEAARDYQVDPRLIAAVIFTESSGKQYACRYEPNFFKKYLETSTRKTLKGFVPPNFQTEVCGRAFSYGLMQIMGNTARENGFTGEYLAELFDPRTNILLGTKILKRFLENEATAGKALLRWNGGSDKEYPTRVFTNYDGVNVDFLLDGGR